VSYQGLILDFGGVITTDFFAALSAFCRREGLPPDAFRQVLRGEGRDLLAAAETGQMSQAQFESALARLLGVDRRGLLRRALADLRPRASVLDLVRRVRASGARAGVLSNSWGSGEYDPYQEYGLDERFDAVIISDRVGLRKPDPAIYRLAAAGIGVARARCVFVDDKASNLPAAAELGLAVVHFVDEESALSEIAALLLPEAPA
jgi:putative hydrolase of the HAD superfamily